MKVQKFILLSFALIAVFVLVACKREIVYETYVPIDHKMCDISSLELVKKIKVGWNLGNSLDVYNWDGLDAETAWGNPKTTFKMIKAVADAGFDSVRVPVTWQRHLGVAPDYLIDDKWLDRVEEVVGYVLSAGMYCILTTHHEDWIFPDIETESHNTEQLIAIWKQISERFKDYNEKLIFAGMNEPRLKGTENEWNGGTTEAHEVVNRLNKAFIDTVRLSGGRNELRHLMIPTYAASAEEVAMEALSNAFPRDDDKIIALINSYMPYNFALNTMGTDRWITSVHEKEVDWLFDKLKEHFLDNGIPVIIGETGVLDKDNLEARVAWTIYYFGKARQLGIPVFWWDNGVLKGKGDIEVLGLLDREQAEFIHPKIMKAIMGK